MDDLNLLRGAITVLSLLGFLAIVAWAWSRRNRARFDEAANLPFADENNISRENRA
jgi:cytochrome c oxidase cbb3-type subunit 4